MYLLPYVFIYVIINHCFPFIQLKIFHYYAVQEVFLIFGTNTTIGVNRLRNSERKEKTVSRIDTMLPTDPHSMVKVVEDSAAKTGIAIPMLTPAEAAAYVQSILNYRNSTDKHLKSMKKYTTIVEGSVEMGEATAYISATDTVLRKTICYYSSYLFAMY